MQHGNQLATNMTDVHEIFLGGGRLFNAFREPQKLDKYEADEFRIITPQDVEFFKRDRDTYVAVDGEWEIKLDKRNDAVGQLALGVDPEFLKHTFLGGRYFIIDDQIVDYRVSTQLSFEHDTKALENLIKHVGLVINDRGRIMVQSHTAKFEYEAFQSEGGLFAIDQGFKWSPFSMDITAVLEMLRLACYNGLTVKDPVFNHKIPVMNGWQENLAIANDVIRHTFDHKVGPRLAQLPEERISLHDAMGLCDLIGKALETKGAVLNHNAVTSIHEKLSAIVTADARSMQKNLLKFIPVPVTAFDAMNIATELSTHHLDVSGPSAHKLAGFANNLLFSEVRQNNMNVDLDKLVMDTKVFSNADQAFHGVTCH